MKKHTCGTNHNKWNDLKIKRQSIAENLMSKHEQGKEIFDYHLTVATFQLKFYI
jgi:hypothetical protein